MTKPVNDLLDEFKDRFGKYPNVAQFNEGKEVYNVGVTAMDTRFSVTHGDSSKELINGLSDVKYNEKGKLIALKFKGEDVKLTAKGGIS